MGLRMKEGTHERALFRGCESDARANLKPRRSKSAEPGVEQVKAVANRLAIWPGPVGRRVAPKDRVRKSNER